MTRRGSNLAAFASRAQGKYQSFFHDALMAASGGLDNERIKAIAESVGLDTARLTRDMESPTMTAMLQRNRRLAKALGISGTPSFILEGRLMRRFSLKEFAALLNDARTAPAK